LQNTAIQEFKEWCIRERDENLKAIDQFESGDLASKLAPAMNLGWTGQIIKKATPVGSWKK